jgi:hypothetical protein
MRITYDAELDALIVSTSGMFSVDVYKNLTGAIMAYHRYRQGIDMIYDFRLVTLSTMSANDVHEFVREAKSLIGKRGSSWCAAFVVSFVASYGTARVFENIPGHSPSNSRSHGHWTNQKRE